MASVMSHSERAHRWQPIRLPGLWYSPGKNTGVGCHFLLQCMKVKSESEVAQSFPTLIDPIVCSLPGSSVHGIFLATVLEWSAEKLPAVLETQEMLVRFLGWEDPLEEENGNPTPVFLPETSHGQRSFVGYCPKGCQESDMTEKLHFHFSLSSIGEGNGNPLQCSCLENPRDGGAWWAALYGVAQS